MALHNKTGTDGENLAAEYLLKSGYKILERNWRFRKTEIDIIACNNEYIIFVEVKTRSSGRWGNPEDAVDKRKIKNIIEAADYFVEKHTCLDLPVRFDVIAIIKNKNSIDLEHFDDAFFAPLNLQ